MMRGKPYATKNISNFLKVKSERRVTLKIVGVTLFCVMSIVFHQNDGPKFFPLNIKFNGNSCQRCEIITPWLLFLKKQIQNFYEKKYTYYKNLTDVFSKIAMV